MKPDVLAAQKPCSCCILEEWNRIVKRHREDKVQFYLVREKVASWRPIVDVRGIGDGAGPVDLDVLQCGSI